MFQRLVCFTQTIPLENDMQYMTFMINSVNLVAWRMEQMLFELWFSMFGQYRDSLPGTKRPAAFFTLIRNRVLPHSYALTFTTQRCSLSTKLGSPNAA